MQVFDYIVNAVKQTGPSIELTDDDDMATREDFSSWEWLVLNVCEVWRSLVRSAHCSNFVMAMLLMPELKVVPA